MNSPSHPSPCLFLKLFVAGLLLLGSAQAQSSSSAPKGVTHIYLGASSEPDSRVYVPMDEEVHLHPPANASANARWRKNGSESPYTVIQTGVLKLRAGDGLDGTYSYDEPTGNVQFGNKVELFLLRSRFVNCSSRIRLAPGKDVQISGFVISEHSNGKNVIIRAVGETLKQFGVTDPVVTPRIRIYDSKGQPVGFLHLHVVHPKEYFDRLFANAGAFPLSDKELPFVSFDWGNLPSGAYTVQVSDDSEKGGEVLVEVYEITQATPL